MTNGKRGNDFQGVRSSEKISPISSYDRFYPLECLKYLRLLGHSTTNMLTTWNINKIKFRMIFIACLILRFKIRFKIDVPLGNDKGRSTY